ncbi:unnamed protein product, partial [Timema podura]|nr:unnamed protein product [Timema podura]
MDSDSMVLMATSIKSNGFALLDMCASQDVVLIELVDTEPSESTGVQKSVKPVAKDGIQFIDYLESKSIMIKERNGCRDDQNNIVSPSLGNSIDAKKKISTKNDEEPNVPPNKFEESIAALDNNQHNCATETLETHDKANCVGLFIKCRTSQNCFPQTKLLHDALLY